VISGSGFVSHVLHTAAAVSAYFGPHAGTISADSKLVLTYVLLPVKSRRISFVTDLRSVKKVKIYL
jgi:hypothetical protein